MSGPGSAVGRRRETILAELAERGRVEVAQLARSLDVAEETVRRDLSALEAVGALIRAHGGAVPADLGAGSETEVLLGPVDFIVDDRGAGVTLPRSAAVGGESTSASATTAATAEVRRRAAEVAEAVLDLLPDTGALYLDGGPVGESIASRISAERRLTIVTTSVPVALAAAEASEPGEVHLLGGRVRFDGTTQGPWARSSAEGVRFAVAVFDGGSDAPGRPVLATDPETGALAEALARVADRVTVTYPGVHPGARASSSAWVTSLPLAVVDTVVAHPFALAGAVDVADRDGAADGDDSDHTRRLAGELRERGIDLIVAGEAA